MIPAERRRDLGAVDQVDDLSRVTPAIGRRKAKVAGACDGTIRTAGPDKSVIACRGAKPEIVDPDGPRAAGRDRLARASRTAGRDRQRGRRVWHHAPVRTEPPREA